MAAPFSDKFIQKQKISLWRFRKELGLIEVKPPRCVCRIFYEQNNPPSGLRTIPLHRDSEKERGRESDLIEILLVSIFWFFHPSDCTTISNNCISSHCLRMRAVGFPLIQLSLFFTKFISPSTFGRVRLFCVHLLIPIFKQRHRLPLHFCFLRFVSIFSLRFFHNSSPFHSLNGFYLRCSERERAQSYVRTITEPWRSTIRVDFTLIVWNNFIFQRNVLMYCLLCVCVCAERGISQPLCLPSSSSASLLLGSLAHLDLRTTWTTARTAFIYFISFLFFFVVVEILFCSAFCCFVFDFWHRVISALHCLTSVPGAVCVRVSVSCRTVQYFSKYLYNIALFDFLHVILSGEWMSVAGTTHELERDGATRIERTNAFHSNFIVRQENQVKWASTCYCSLRFVCFVVFTWKIGIFRYEMRSLRSGSCRPPRNMTFNKVDGFISFLLNRMMENSQYNILQFPIKTTLFFISKSQSI